jgi:hypothetical protein
LNSILNLYHNSMRINSPYLRDRHERERGMGGRKDAKLLAPLFRGDSEIKLGEIEIGVAR